MCFVTTCFVRLSIVRFTVGTNLMTLPYIRVANFLPALVIAVVWGVMLPPFPEPCYTNLLPFQG